MKSTNSVEWTSESAESLNRTALGLDCRDEHVKTFALSGLPQALQEFGVGMFEASPVIEWYWKTARSWPHKTSQSAFDSYARARLSDHVGYTRRRADAFSVTGRLFDKARSVGLTLDEILDAVTFLSPTKTWPHGVIPNTTVALIDVTMRADSPKVLKVDAGFLPVLQRLYPWERIDDVLIKQIPTGETTTREFSLLKFAWWFQHQNTTLAEMTHAIAFRSADRLDWTRANLFSEWRADAEAFDSGVPTEFPEGGKDHNGDVRMGRSEYVGLSEGASAGRNLVDDIPARPTKTASVHNWVRERLQNHR